MLRLSVDGGGCAGFTYNFALGDVEEGDAVAETDGVTSWWSIRSASTWCADRRSIMSRISAARRSRSTNPNAASGCGCGSSFRSSADSVKLATYNLNGIRARLPRLIEWLEREATRRRLPAGTQMRRRIAADRRHRGGGLWRGVARPEGLQRRRDPRREASARAAPRRPARAIPTTATAATSRRRSTASSSPRSILPNGNPVGTEKFAYKLKWMERLAAHAARLLRRGAAGRAGRRLQRHPRGPRRLLGPGDAA